MEGNSICNSLDKVGTMALPHPKACFSVIALPNSQYRLIKYTFTDFSASYCAYRTLAFISAINFI